MAGILESRGGKLRLTSGLKALKGGLQENKEFGSGKAFEKFEFLLGKHKPIRCFLLTEMVMIPFILARRS